METIKIKVSEATNTQLDWLVAKCEGLTNLEIYDGCEGGDRTKPRKYLATEGGYTYNYTTNPAQMWRIIEAHPEMQFWPWGGKSEGRNGELQCASLPSKIDGGTRHKTWFGKTKLIAAARCYIAAELGEVVDVPKVLMVDSPTPEPADAEGDEPSTPAPGA